MLILSTFIAEIVLVLLYYRKITKEEVMNAIDKRTGKTMFFVLHYEFPQGICKTEKWQRKNSFRKRVGQLKRYEKIGIIRNLVA